MKRTLQILISITFLLILSLLEVHPTNAEASDDTFYDIVKIPAGGENYGLEVFGDQIIVTDYSGGYQQSVKVKSYNKNGELNWMITDAGIPVMNEYRISILQTSSGRVSTYSTATGEQLSSAITGFKQGSKFTKTKDYQLLLGPRYYSVSNSHGAHIMTVHKTNTLSGVIQGDVLVIQDKKSIQAFDLSTRKSMWTVPIVARFGSHDLLKPVNGLLYAFGEIEGTDSHSKLFAIDAQTGAILHTKDFGDNSNSFFSVNELGLHERNEVEDIHNFFGKDGKLKMTLHMESPAIKQLKEKYYVPDTYHNYSYDWKFVENGFYYFKHYTGLDEEYAFSSLKKLDMNGKVQFDKTFDNEYIFAMETTDSGKLFVANGKAFGRHGYRRGTGFKGYNGLNELSVYDSNGKLLDTIETEYIDKLKYDGGNLYGYGDETIYIFKESEPKPEKSVSRIAGASRFNTAVAISKAGWKTADTVVLATSGDFPDALSGGPLAYQEDAPILLTRPEKLPHETKTEIERLKPKKAIVLGSQSAVSLEVEKELQRMGIEIERIGGKNRFDTAALIAQRLDSQEAVVAYGFNFPDVLSVSAYASKNGIPILLTRTDKLPAETEAALATTTKTHVIGSTGAVGQTVFNALPNPVRYGGANRYETGLQVNSKLKMGTDQAYIATGMNFPDALAGSVLAAKNDAPILLVQRDIIPSATAKQLPDYNAYTIFGGTGVISGTLRDQLSTYGN